MSVRRLVASLLTLLVSLLGLLQPTAAVGAPVHAAAAYTYDGDHHTAGQTYTTSERGPPSTCDHGRHRRRYGPGALNTDDFQSDALRTSEALGSP